MSRFAVREFQAPGLDISPGEILVPAQLGDPVHGMLSCPAAPLIEGTLRRRNRDVRQASVPQLHDRQQDGDGAAVFVVTCQQREGRSVALAAAASPADRLAVALARSAVAEWAAVIGTRTLLLAPGPWCEGARRALTLAEKAVANADGRTVHVLGELAASPQAAAALAAQGAQAGTGLGEMTRGDLVVIPAHGLPDAERAQAAERGLHVIDATCPLVAEAQAQARTLLARGDQLVLIGRPGSAAATAITGQDGPEEPDEPGAVTIASPAATAGVRAADSRRLSYLLQPGIPLEDSVPVAAALRSRFPAVRGPHPDGFCYAATDRADSIRMVAAAADVLLILGTDSADARQLASLALSRGARPKTVAGTGDITPDMVADVPAIAVAESAPARAGLAAEVTAAARPGSAR